MPTDLLRNLAFRTTICACQTIALSIVLATAGDAVPDPKSLATPDPKDVAPPVLQPKSVALNSPIRTARPVGPNNIHIYQDIQKQVIRFEMKVMNVSKETYAKNKDTLNEGMKRMDEATAVTFLRSLGKMEGCDLLSAPDISVKQDERAAIEVTREIRYPVDFSKGKDGLFNPVGFESRNCGITFSFTPKIDGSTVQLNGQFDITTFLGFTDSEAGVKVPSFDIRVARVFRELKNDECVCMWLSKRPDAEPKTAEAGTPAVLDNDASADAKDAKLYAVFFRVHILPNDS